MTKGGKKKKKFNSTLGGNINPFEVHINNSKHTILGQKTKDDRGLPGVSRSKAFKKREKTLQNEFNNRHKSGRFLDKRIGEYNASMDPEQKVMMRMIAEKKKQLSKKSLYTLNDDEELLHHGKPLNETTMRDMSDDDEYDDDLLDGKFVEDQHFGGDLFTKPKEKDGEADNSGLKSRKEWIEEMIAESKKKKAETKMEKEIHNNAVTKLNEKFQGFLQAMKGRIFTEEEKMESKKTCEYRDFDILVKELEYDRSKRAKPADKLKTEEEIAKEEHDRLQKLEEERRRRMNGEEYKNSSNQKSADALDDGFTYFKKDPLTLEDLKKERSNLSENQISKGNSKTEDTSTISNNIEEESEASDEEGSEEDDESEEGSREESEEEDEDEQEIVDDPSEMKESRKTKVHANDNLNNGVKNEIKNKQSSFVETKEIENADENPISNENRGNFSEEIPFTFEVPSEYDDFWNLLENQMPPQVSTIIERMITCNHPSLGADKKTKANTIFAYILQTLQNICCVEPEILRSDCHPFSYISSLIPHLYTLTQINPNDCSAALIEVLDEKHEEYASQKMKKYPYFDTFVYLKTAGLLFPASDLHHVVMTRVLTFLAQIAYESKVSCGRDIISLLFTSGTLIEYLSQSRRFLGEVANVLNGILYLSISKRDLKKNLSIAPSFKSLGPFSELLVLSGKCQRCEEDIPELKLSLINEEICINNKWKVTFLNEALRQLNKLCRIWENSPAVRSIFLPTTLLLEHLPIESYPVSTQSLFETLKTSIKNLPKQVPHLRKEETIVKTLKMVDPCIEDVSYNLKRRGDKETKEKQKLLHKLKRERKGVKRELKRDANFLARLQLKEVLEKDAERKRKVNLIMQGLATQEHEFKKFKKK